MGIQIILDNFFVTAQDIVVFVHNSCLATEVMVSV
jgi:hypothetical protein